MIVAGIDPGLANTGFGVIQRTGNRISALDWGVLRSTGSIPLAERLEKIYSGLSAAMKKHHPDIVAIEEIFTGRNPRVALLVGHARGVAVLSAAREGYEVREFAARTIKQAVVGRGNASKEQVAYMVNRILGLGDSHLAKDASDALAVAVCCLMKSDKSAIHPALGSS